ncbi:MAG: hypothetical protein HYV09_10380 [Deltaproteobacteria bacterium]|nr:hypothetical protein [Deltaproteobacteria bacterium]
MRSPTADARVTIVAVALGALALAACVIGPKQDDPATLEAADAGEVRADTSGGGGGGPYDATDSAVASPDAAPGGDTAAPPVVADGDACPGDGDACATDAASDAVNDGDSDSGAEGGAPSDAVSGG